MQFSRTRVASLGMNGNSHVMRMHHLLIGSVCALMLAGCAGTQEYPPMDADGTYFHIQNGAAGAWETTGSARTEPDFCSWFRVSAPNANAKIIAGGTITRNVTTRVTIKSGEWFVSNGCQPWHHV